MAEHLTDCKSSWFLHDCWFVSSAQKVIFSFHVCVTQSVYWSDCQQDYAKTTQLERIRLRGQILEWSFGSAPNFTE